MVFCRSDCGGEVGGGGGGMVAGLVMPCSDVGAFPAASSTESIQLTFCYVFFLQILELTTDLGTMTNTQEAPSDQPGPLPSVSNCKYRVVVRLN